MMSKKNIWILILLIIGIGGIIAIEGYAKPKAREQAAQYEAEQKSPYTHDISRSLKFRSKYMTPICSRYYPKWLVIQYRFCS